MGGSRNQNGLKEQGVESSYNHTAMLLRTNDDLTQLEAKLFRGLSDPSRLAILKLLRDGEKPVSAIVDASGFSQPNVSGHLSCLRECGLVASRQEGRQVIYMLADERMEDLLLVAGDILARIAERLYNCTRYRA